MADQELDKLSRYMLHIANVVDFRTLSHKVGDWHSLLLASDCTATVRIGGKSSGACYDHSHIGISVSDASFILSRRVVLHLFYVWRRVVVMPTPQGER
jgi:hypothetical protein